MTLELLSVNDLPIRTLDVAASGVLEDARGEQAFPIVSALCQALTTDTVPSRLDRFGNMEARCANARQIAVTKLGLANGLAAMSGKDKAAVKKARGVEEALAALGFGFSSIDTDEAFVIKELAEAIQRTIETAQNSDPMGL